MEYWIGIDFGTTKTTAAVWKEKVGETIFNNYNRITPSVVAFDKYVRYIGDHIELDPVNTVFDMKRLLGANSRDIENAKNYYPFGLSNDENERILVTVTYCEKQQALHPEQLCAMVFMKIVESARIHFEDRAANINAVITVPIAFSPSQKQAVFDSAKVAGIMNIQMISDALAVALYHGWKIDEHCSQKLVLIVDIGGGSCGISLAFMEHKHIQIVESFGIPKLGGENFTRYLFDYFARQHNIGNSPDEKKELRDICEEMKKKLSFAKKNSFQSDQLKLTFAITREEYEQVCQDLFTIIGGALEQALEYSNREHFRITEVLLLGGTIRIPKIQSLITEKFNTASINKSMTEETVGYGAALWHYISKDYEDMSTHYRLRDYGDMNIFDLSRNEEIRNWERTEKYVFQAEDERQRERMRERNAFEKTVLDRKKLSEEGTHELDEKVTKLCNDNIDWLARNIGAFTEELTRQKEKFQNELREIEMPEYSKVASPMRAEDTIEYKTFIQEMRKHAPISNVHNSSNADVQQPIEKLENSVLKAMSEYLNAVGQEKNITNSLVHSHPSNTSYESMSKDNKTLHEGPAAKQTNDTYNSTIYNRQERKYEQTHMTTPTTGMATQTVSIDVQTNVSYNESSGSVGMSADHDNVYFKDIKHFVDSVNYLKNVEKLPWKQDQETAFRKLQNFRNATFVSKDLDIKCYNYMTSFFSKEYQDSIIRAANYYIASNQGYPMAQRATSGGGPSGAGPSEGGAGSSGAGQAKF